MGRSITTERIWQAVHGGAFTPDTVASALRVPSSAQLNGLINSMVVSGMLRKATFGGQLSCGERPDPVRRTQPARVGAGTVARQRSGRTPDTPAGAVRHAPSGVPFPRESPERDRIEVEPHWLTGVPEEDRRVRNGMCPFQIQTAGWGQREIFCGAQRSPNDGDGPYCRPHAAEIRLDRGYGGPV